MSDDTESARPAVKPALWTSSTYFAEGLPWSLLHQVAGELLTAVGLPPRMVGYTSALHLTSSLKFLWSPFVDLFGTLRRWMLWTQALMGAAVMVLALAASQLAAIPEPIAADTTWVWLLLIVIGVLSATHDIACDGYYMDALDTEDQARYSGIRVAAFRVAMVVGSGGLVYIGGRVGWLYGFGAGALMLVGLAVVHRMVLPRGDNERRQAKVQTAWRQRLGHVWAAYKLFLIQPHVVVTLAFIISFKLGDALMFSMSKVLLRELGVVTADRAVINVSGTLAMIAGAMIGGAWVARRGLVRTIVPIALLMALSEPVYLWLAFARLPGYWLEPFGLGYLYVTPSLFWISATVVLEQFAGGMATAAQMIFIMRRCHPDHKAAHFAFATALYAAAQTVTGTYSGILYETHGPVFYFGLASVICIPSLVLAGMIAREPSQIQ